MRKVELGKDMMQEREKVFDDVLLLKERNLSDDEKTRYSQTSI
jgi:hypothetical protein